MNRFLILSSGLLVAPSFAVAQTAPEVDGWQVTVGAGALYSPTYEGDDDYTVSALPNLQFKYEDKFFASVQEGVGYNLVKTDAFTVGPIGRVKFSRKENGDQPFAIAGDETTELQGLGDIDTTLEFGGFLSFDTGPITLGAEARQAFSGHEGFVADLNARWGGRMFTAGPPVFWSIGPRVRIVDQAYNEAYFGVSAEQAIASGLPEYQTDGGLYSYGLGATAVVPLDRAFRWSAVVLAGYDQLTGDAGDSPLVQLRGDQDQVTFGVFLSRSFD